MFNSYSKPGTRIDFVSNPPLPDEAYVAADQNYDGNLKNVIRYRPKSNRSFFEGVSFQEETMSLRAKLNLGIPFTRVSNVSIDNDPIVLQRTALHLEQSIKSKLDSLTEVHHEADVPQSTSQSTSSES